MKYLIATLATLFIAVLGIAGWTLTHDNKLGASVKISDLTSLNSPSYSDVLPIVDNGTTKKLTWANATSSIKGDFDLIYSPLAGSASLVTLGTVTSGTWNGTTISAANGGTGSTTLAANQLLFGNGTSQVQTIAPGTSGYILTSNGAGSLPSFQNVAVALNTNNTWTGTNLFTASTTMSATTSIAASNVLSNALILNSLPYKFPQVRGASSTALLEDGSGNLSFDFPKTKCSTFSTSTTNLNTWGNGTITFNHGLGTTPSVIRARWWIFDPTTTASESNGWGEATTTGSGGGGYMEGYHTALGTGSINTGENGSFVSMHIHDSSGNRSVLTEYVSSWTSSTVVLTSSGNPSEANMVAGIEYEVCR